ncbi:MAG: DUF255 domain-containing protein [Candidatus Aquicultorales bacterium]
MPQLGVSNQNGFAFSPRRNRASRIAWREWSGSAFAEAQDRDIPVFLALTASWSDRSHRLDETALSDPRVIRYLNKHCMPVRVDGDRRPDVGARYAHNGWPTIAFLTPRGDIITGRNGISPASLLALAKRVDVLYNQEAIALKFASQKARRDLIADEYEPLRTGDLDTGFYTVTTSLVANSLDDDSRAGLRGAVDPASIELLLRSASNERIHLLDIACAYLDRAYADGLFDTESGGFYQGPPITDGYKAKALSTNAAMIEANLLAYRLTRMHKYHEAAFKSLDFVERRLGAGTHGGFCAATDVVSDKGYVASRTDETILVDANCRMVDVYLEAHRISRDPKYLSFALATLDFLWITCFEPESGLAHYIDSRPRLFGRLEDQAWAIKAFAKAAAVTGERGYMVRAIELHDIAREFLYDGRVFYDGPSNPEAPGLLKLRLRPLVGNAVMARALTALAAGTKDSSYAETARGVLASLKTDCVTRQEAAELALAFMRLDPEAAGRRRAA